MNFILILRSIRFVLISILISTYPIIFNDQPSFDFEVYPEKAAIITSVYGNREKTLKPTTEQTYPTDYYAFVNNNKVVNNGEWKVDSIQYQVYPLTKSPLDDGRMVNSLEKNKHPYMQYKYYKMQFHLLPQLKKYRYVLWLDSSFKVVNPNTISILIDLLKEHDSPIILYNHPRRRSIKDECRASAKDGRWKANSLWGIPQPFQDVRHQTEYYYSTGYNEKYFRDHEDIDNYGLWVTGFYLFDMMHPKAIPLLDEWYLQTLNHTTQCQISFPYSAWKQQIYPVSIHSGTIYVNDFLKYYGHKK